MTLALVLLSYAPVSGLVSSNFHLSFTQSGLVTSLYEVGVAITPIPGGYLADRFGGSKTLVTSLSISAAGSLAFALAPNYPTVLVSRAIVGGTTGIVVPASVRLLAGLFQERRLTMAMGVFQSGWGVAEIVSYFFLPLLIVGQNWRPPLLLVAAFVSVVAVMALPLVRWEKRTAVDDVKLREGGPRFRGLFTRQLIVLITVNGVSVAVTTAVLVWSPTLLTASMGVSIVDSGRIIALAGIANIVGSLAGPLSSRRFGARITVAVSMVLLATLPVVLGFSTSLLVAAFCIAGIGWAQVFYSPTVFALVPFSWKDGQSRVGLSIGIFSTFGTIGPFLSPLIVGRVLDLNGGFGVAFSILGLIGVLGVITTLFLRDRFITRESAGELR